MPVASTKSAVGKEKPARNRLQLTRGKFALREVIVGWKCHSHPPVDGAGPSRDRSKMSLASAGCRDLRHVVALSSASVAGVLMTRSIIGDQGLIAVNSILMHQPQISRPLSRRVRLPHAKVSSSQ
jgi:hypothetical protein